MKINKRNIATIVLAILCAIALAIGVSFVAPKVEKISANAATNAPTYSFANVRSYQSNTDQASLTYSDLTGNSYTRVNDSTWYETGNYSNFNAMYLEMTTSIVVPPLTEYKVKYTFCLRSCPAGASVPVHCTADLLYLDDANDSNISQITNSLSFPNTQYSISSLDFSSPNAWLDAGYVTVEVSYANDTTSNKTCNSYWGLYGCAFCSAGARMLHVSLEYGAYTVEVVTSGVPSVNISSPTTFDDNYHNFTFTYDKDHSVVTSIEKEDFGNNKTSLYSYDIATDTETGTNLIDGNGVLSLKEAGTYYVSFDALKNYWPWSDTNKYGTRTLTITIERAKLTVPTILQSQPYTGSALTFPLTNFNMGQYISMDGVTPPANGSAVTDVNGGTPTDTTDTFYATSVGKYTVNLSLRDTNNYTWTDGTSNSKSVYFEITKKELLSSAPVSSAVNGIGGAEWQYQDNTVTVQITDDRVLGETVNLSAYYDAQGSTSSPIPLTANLSTSGNVTTISMPNNIPVGKYTLTVALNGSLGDNGNYQITQNDTLDFEIKAAAVDPSNYTWIYTKDGAPGSTITDGDKLPFVLKTGSTTDGVKYELSIQIPSSDSVALDTTKYSNGYQYRNGDSVGTYKTVVALKSTDPTFQFEVNGVMQSTIDVELNWEIEKGTFDLSNVEWEYNLDGTSTWAKYDPANPPQYNDGNYVTVRIKESSLPAGLTLDPNYIGMEQWKVGTYTATISASDFVYSSTNFNTPDVSVSTLTLSWQIEKKNLYTKFKNVQEQYTNANYSGTFILKQLDVPAGMESYISYTYYDQDTGAVVTLNQVKDAVDLTTEKTYKVVATIDPAYSANYTVDDNGASPYDTFTTGSQNELAKATIDGNDGQTVITVEYDGNTHFDSTLIAVKSDSGVVTDYTVVYYAGKTATSGNELSAGELPKDAGDYCIQIVLGTTASRRYILERDTFEIKIEAKGIAVPTLGEMVFNGKELNFEDFLGGTWNDYKSIIKIDGKLSDRNVASGNYVTTLTLTDGNYKWLYPSSATPVKASKTAVASDVKVTGDDAVATYNWNITPLVVDTTNLWNKSANGATLNLPQTVKDVIAGGTLAVGYRYYDGDGTLLDEVELKAGRSFKVEAVFTGDDAERNVQFKTGDADYGAVSKSIDYTVPTSGMQAFADNVKAFMTGTLLGLPVWAWFLIGLALLILLIIIIVVAVKRRKTKEQREEIKAKKEEEKQRREEERQRREEERQAQKERLEAERELAKAKQEAELEKIRAQAGMGMAGAGMATMAMQQQPQQAQQPAPQYSADGSVLAEIRAELAEIKARQNMGAGYAQVPMQMPMPMPMQMPMAMPQYMPMPQPQGGSAGGYEDARLLLAEERARTAESRLADERARAAEEKSYRSMEERAMLAEERFVRGNGIPMQLPAQSMPAQTPMAGANPDFIGAVIASALRNSGVAPTALTNVQPVAEPQPADEKAVVSTPALYPSDAVITTTTTVDTTKGKPVMRSREETENFDVDGFYDNADY